MEASSSSAQLAPQFRQKKADRHATKKTSNLSHSAVVTLTLPPGPEAEPETDPWPDAAREQPPTMSKVQMPLPWTDLRARELEQRAARSSADAQPPVDPPGEDGNRFCDEERFAGVDGREEG